MRTRPWQMALLCVFAASLVFAAGYPFAGTWSIDLAKSTYGGGDPPKSRVITFKELPDGSFHNVSDVVRADGTKEHFEYTAKRDGKDYPVTGVSSWTTINITVVDARSDKWFTKGKDGKVLLTGTTTISADGKQLTIVWSGKNAEGKAVSGTAVYKKK